MNIESNGKSQLRDTTLAGESSQPNHIRRIDVLRAVAILLVFSSHFDGAVYGVPGYKWIGNWYHWSDSPSPLGVFLRLSVFNGNMGVNLFFVISGLCIRLSQLGSKSFSIPYFYWRRVWRIYPPYLLALAICVIWQRNGDLGNILAHALLIHNFFRAYFQTIYGPFWSLALEMQVYFLYPCLLALHYRFGAIRTAIFFFVLSAVPEVIGGESFRTHFHLSDSFAVFRQLPTSLWFTWYMGFLLADALVASATPGRLSRIVLLIALVLYPMSKMYRLLGLIQLPVAGIILALLAFEYLTSPSMFPTMRRMWACLGLCSYSFYLYFDQFIHPCLDFVRKSTHIESPELLYAVGYPFTFLVLFGFSYLAFRATELPSISLGRSLYAKLARKAPLRGTAPA